MRSSIICTSSLGSLVSHSDIFDGANVNRTNFDTATPQRHMGTWKVTKSISCISILQVCQESRAETQDITGTYLMLRLDTSNTQRSWFNPATDSITISFPFENGKQKKLLRPGFPLTHTITQLMDRKLLDIMNDEFGPNRENITKPFTLPDPFEYGLRCLTYQLSDLEEWEKVYFHHFHHNGVKTFGMSVYRHLVDMLGRDFLNSEAGKHVASPCIEIGKSIRDQWSPEDLESQLLVCELTWAWVYPIRKVGIFQTCRQ